MEPLVYIVLVNWNGLKDTIECISSLKKLNYKNFVIVVVDNGSIDNSESVIKEMHSDVVVLQTGSNLGFAGANNIGMELSIAKGADYIWLLNNDTIVDADALKNALLLFQEIDKVGAVGSKIYYYHNPNVIWALGGKCNFRTGDAEHIAMNEIDNGQYEIPIEVDYVVGCSMIIPVEVIKKVGFMDTQYFHLQEDADLSFRIKREGYKLFVMPKSKVWHKTYISTGGISPLYYYYQYRNRLLFLSKFYANNFPTLYIVYRYTRAVLRFLLKERKPSCAFAVIKGSVDFLRGIKGKVK